MNKITQLIISIALFLPAASYALTCPTNFNLIKVGDTIETVTQVCGKPASETTKEVPKEVPQEWTYYTQQDPTTTKYTNLQGTLKSSVSFDKDGKVINLSVNGIGIGASSICGTQIALGATREQVKAACGEPSIVNKQSSTTSDDQPTTDKITTYTYNSTPPVTLKFKNGILTE